MANPRICSVDGCSKPVRCRGYCGTHYQRVRAHGDANRVLAGGNKKGCSLPLRVTVDIDRLKWLYVIERKPSNEIALIFGCSKPTILSRLRQAGVPIRHHNDTKRGAPSPHRQRIDVKKAVRLYSRKNASVQSVADALGVGCGVVRRHLKEAGVRLKSLSEIVDGARSGEANPNWNPDLTPKERDQRRDIASQAKWRARVFKRDGFTCRSCGDRRGRNLNAHHLTSHHADKAKRWLVSNGVTLCSDCHRSFHKAFGYRNNTESQFEEFLSAQKGAMQ